MHFRVLTVNIGIKIWYENELVLMWVYTYIGMVLRSG